MNYLQLPNGILPHLARLSGVQVAIWADAWTWEQQGAQAYRTNAQLAEMLGVTVKSVSCACKCAAERFTGTVTVEGYPRPDWYDTPQCGCMAGFNLKTFNTKEK